MEATRKSKIIVIGFLVFAVLMGVFSYMSISASSDEHVQQIHQVVDSHGGKVEQIIAVPLEESPFDKSGKGNTIFKITYSKNGQSLTAWYRADNHTSIKKEKEEWIIQE